MGPRPVNERQFNPAAQSQLFRLQFYGVATDRGPAILLETPMQAGDASAAIRLAAQAAWPANAIGLRVLDREGQEVFDRLKADRR
jgi:hypothetical protein